MTRPMSEERAGELIDALENAAMDFVLYGRASDHKLLMEGRASLRDALLSTSSAERGMREALEKAEHALTYAVIRMERDFLIGKLEATLETVRAALSSKGEG